MNDKVLASNDNIQGVDQPSNGKLKAASLFCGCGGSDLGLRNLGVEVVWANDVWAPATEVYKRNFPETTVVCADVRIVREFPRAEILVGCYPCQGFSQGGKRDPDAQINQLFREFSRALSQVRPKAFIVENVIGMTFGRNTELLNLQVRSFRSRGYKVKWKLVDARDYGLAQERKRVFIIGTRSDLNLDYVFPDPTHGPGTGQSWRSQQEVLSNFDEWPDDGYDKQSMSWYYLSRRRRREWHEPAPCVVASSRQVALHPVSPPLEYVGPDRYRFSAEGQARRYTYLECAALQGFPGDFDWGDRSLSTKYRMIGNAVPPPLIEAVARPLIGELLKDR